MSDGFSSRRPLAPTAPLHAAMDARRRRCLRSCPHAFVRTHPSSGEGAHARRRGSRGRVADGIASPPRRVQVMPSWADRPGKQEARSAPSRNLICRNQQQTLLGRSCCHHSCPLVAATVEWQNATTGAHYPRPMSGVLAPAQPFLASSRGPPLLFAGSGRQRHQYARPSVSKLPPRPASPSCVRSGQQQCCDHPPTSHAVIANNF